MKFNRESIHYGNSELVYFISKTEGPVVILMHELFGLTKPTVEYAEELCSHGFQVVLPVFGPITCIREEVFTFATGQYSPITDGLRQLVAKVGQQQGIRKGVGVIGMCMTGGFALAMMVQPDGSINEIIKATVVAQPSLPLFNRSGLGLNKKQIAGLQQWSRTHPQCRVLALRFSADPISPRRRMERLREVLGEGCLQWLDIPSNNNLRLHSTLIEHHEQAMNAREAVLSYLQSRLIAQ